MVTNKIISVENMGLSSMVFQCSCSPGFSLQLRHKSLSQSLQRGFRCNPAAHHPQEQCRALPAINVCRFIKPNDYFIYGLSLHK